MKDVTTNSTGITVRDLGFRYARTSADVLQDVSLDVEPGDVTALVGPSGCGKSTLLRLVAGLLEPTRGQLLVGTKDMRGTKPEERMIGWVPQSYGLFNHLTVEDNVAFGLRARKASRSDTQEQVRRSLELCEIGELATRYPSALSGGQRQRVAIARAVATRPRVLLLDEPLAALDPQLRRHLRVTLAALLRDLGVTTIMVTHDQTEALAMANRVAVMRGGRLEQVASPEVLWSRPANSFVAEFVGSAKVLEGRSVASGYEIAEGLVVNGGLDKEKSKASFALRANDLEFSSTGAAFRVLSHEYTGDAWRITGELVEDGRSLEVLSATSIEIGEVRNVRVRATATISEVVS